MPVHPLPWFFEPVNALLHLGAALVFAVLGARIILRTRGDPLATVLVSIFAVSSVLMLSISGVYHTLTGGGRGSAVFLRMDKAAVFVLIAGTFTPIHGLLFRGPVRWGGLGLMWAAAATGVTLVAIFSERMPRGLGTTLYLALGWVAGFSVVALWRRRGFRYIRGILAGGVAYSAGAILLGLKWPTLLPGYVGPHELWHVMVLIGLGLHWRFIARLVGAAGPAPRERSGRATDPSPRSAGPTGSRCQPEQHGDPRQA